MQSEHMDWSHKHIAHEANKPTRLLLSSLCQGYYTKNDETKIVWKRFENANKHTKRFMGALRLVKIFKAY